MYITDGAIVKFENKTGIAIHTGFETYLDSTTWMIEYKNLFSVLTEDGTIIENLYEEDMEIA